MAKAKSNERIKQRTIALERMERLFTMAKDSAHENPEFSRMCIEHARIIGMKYRVRQDKSYTRCYCRKCGNYLIAGFNARVRINRGKVTVTCGMCGNIKRYPLGVRK